MYVMYIFSQMTTVSNINGIPKGGKRTLSGNVLEMKFMQRSKTRIESEKRRSEEDKLKRIYLDKVSSSSTMANQTTTIVRKAIVGDALSSVPSTSSGAAKRPATSWIFERRYDLLEDLKFGRQSFNGFNPEVEKLMQYYEDLRAGFRPEDDDNDAGSKDVDDEEMAETLSGGSMATSMSNRFKTKRQRKSNQGEGNRQAIINEAVKSKKRKPDPRQRSTTKSNDPEEEEEGEIR